MATTLDVDRTPRHRGFYPEHTPVPEARARLLAAGRMRPASLAEVEAAKADGRWAAAYEPQRNAPPHPTSPPPWRRARGRRALSGPSAEPGATLSS